jgi:excisionase family DNA binding protein
MNEELVADLEQLPCVLRVEEVAALLRIGRNSAYELIRQGVLPSLRLGRRLVVPKQSLVRVLDNADKAPGRGEG